MLANVSSAQSVSRCRLLSRTCVWCTAIATGTSTTRFQGCSIAISASAAPSPASPALATSRGSKFSRPRTTSSSTARTVRYASVSATSAIRSSSRRKLPGSPPAASKAIPPAHAAIAYAPASNRRLRSAAPRKSAPAATPAAATSAAAHGPRTMIAAICTAHASLNRSVRIGSRERSRSGSSKSSTRIAAARKRAKAVCATSRALTPATASRPRPSVIVASEERDGRMSPQSAVSGAALRLGPNMSGTCRIVALGGLGEVGKNMTVYECDGTIVVVDAGLAFPRDEHLGVDLVLPDFTYLRERADSIRAVILTHGHEDHVGALPYLMREVEIPEVWATRLTLGLIKSKLDEHGLLRAAELREVHPDDPPRELGPFRIEFVRMAHAVPDAVGIMRDTPRRLIFHTGDYKLDHTPVDGLKTDVGRLAELGNRGVDLLLGDSTNAERPGFTPSERIVGEAFRQIFPLREGRILVSSFASNVHRMQQACDVAVELGRKICIVGRSMRKNANIARNLGYMDVPEGMLVRPNELENLPPNEQLILCTGSQGEPLSALTRIAYNDHPALRVERGDTVIISAKPVPGNELRVHDTINQLAKSGAEVLHQEIAPVHVSGHGNAEELRTVLGLVRPKGVMPVHGEFRMLAAHAQLARESGVPAGSIVLAENGSVVELDERGPRIVDRVETGVTFVDGLGVGDVRDVAIRDRRHLSEHGVVIVVATVGMNGARATGAPELIARGFGETAPLLDEMRGEAERVLAECLDGDVSEIKLLQEHLHDALAQLVYDRTGRRPMILPVIVEV